MTLLAARGLSKRFPEGLEVRHVLRELDLDLDGGTLTALAGPSGSGKSVLLDVLAGWSRPDAGTVLWSGGSRPPNWSGLGLVPQAMGLMPDLTVWHNVVLPVRLARGVDGLRADRDRIGHLLDRLGLGALRERSPGELSFGEQQRVAVARAVVMDPRLVLADEPTSHQDAESAWAVLDVLNLVCERGGAVLVASHAEEVLTACDSVLWLRDGSLQRDPVQ